jgi:hypothetical protein
MGDVIRPDFITKHDIPAEDVINGAKDAKFESVMVVGWTKDEGHYLASSTGDAAEMLFILELAKKRVIDEVTNEE